MRATQTLKFAPLFMVLLSSIVEARTSPRDIIGGLRADGLGCRWVDNINDGVGSVGNGRVRTCYTAYRSTVGSRAQQSASAAAALCRRLHDGWLASMPNAAVQSWLEESLNLKYVSTLLTHQSLQSVGEFWFGAELVGMTRRRWSWRGNTLSGSTDALTYTNWFRGHPLQSSHQACAYVEPTRSATSNDAPTWKWKTDRCYRNKHFICEHRERNQTTAIQACGQPAIEPTVSRRIVGGVEAEPHSWPWMVSLQADYNHLCGGSLISDRWVMTAAHCFNALRNISVKHAVIGLHRKTRPDDRITVRLDISRLIPSPQYGKPQRDSYDVMLVELAHPVTFNDAVSPVCMPTSTATVVVGTRCYTTGWGTTSQQLDGYNPDALRQVELPIIDTSVCNRPLWYNGRIDESMICAGYEQGGRDTCQGDSGGPLVCLNDGRWVMYGVTSWGTGCGRARKPGVYARVSLHRQWVDQTIREASRN